VGAAEALGGSTHDRLKNTLGVLIDLIVPDPKNRPPFLLEKEVAPLISLRFSMLATVEFHDQPGLSAREIGKVRADWQLARELRPHTRQDSPKLSLMFGGIAAKRTRALRLIEWHTPAHGRNVSAMSASRTHPWPLPSREGIKTLVSLLPGRARLLALIGGDDAIVIEVLAVEP